MHVLALDIGGSSVKSGVFDLECAGSPAVVEASERVELASRDFSELETLVYAIVAAALERHPDLRRVGISTTGSVDRQGTVVGAGHIARYVDVAWGRRLRQRFPACGAS